jgi:transcriptional regulator with XRE-family HTH domain
MRCGLSALRALEWSLTRRKRLMQAPGKKLRSAREALSLRYRDVEQASQALAAAHHNPEFAIGLSRLADIENKGTLPTVYRLYSLCVIYRLQFASVLQWYGVDLDEVPHDVARHSLTQTHVVSLQPAETFSALLPTVIHPDFNPARTSFISRQVQQWGRLPFALLGGVDLKKYRYAYIGTEDWFMYPILYPGALVQIDESRKRIAKEGWTNEHERPIYLVEHRYGHTCAWCTEREGWLILQPHSSSKEAPQLFRNPGEAEILGQVIGVAMRLDPGKRRHIHS